MGLLWISQLPILPGGRLLVVSANGQTFAAGPSGGDCRPAKSISGWPTSLN